VAIRILLGGRGQRTTLSLAARHADACNLFGDAVTIRTKVAALPSHCERHGREPAAVEVTHLSTAVAAATRREPAADVARLSGDPVVGRAGAA
jgi:alkanesulfonate monooxygenase SsuD/methylene tetrahydromethanopterin reductase-like flavin-dependent oxidoreductase (luciferase family)